MTVPLVPGLAERCPASDDVVAPRLLAQVVAVISGLTPRAARKDVVWIEWRAGRWALVAGMDVAAIAAPPFSGIAHGLPWVRGWGLASLVLTLSSFDVATEGLPFSGRILTETTAGVRLLDR